MPHSYQTGVNNCLSFHLPHKNCSLIKFAYHFPFYILGSRFWCLDSRQS